MNKVTTVQCRYTGAEVETAIEGPGKGISVESAIVLMKNLGYDLSGYETN